MPLEINAAGVYHVVPCIIRTKLPQSDAVVRVPAWEPAAPRYSETTDRLRPRIALAHSSVGSRSSRSHVNMSMFRPLVLVGGALTVSLLAMDWIAGLSFVVLWGGTFRGSPVLRW